MAGVAGFVLAASAAAPLGDTPGAPLDRDARRWIDRTLAAMTLDDKIGQLLVPTYDSVYLSTDSDAFDVLARAVREWRVGGFVAFGERARPVPAVLLNPTYAAVMLADPFAMASTANRLQALSRIPLLNAADFETGPGFRLEGATAFPRAMAFGAAGDERLAYEAGRITAIEGRALGMHVNFAPVADVNNNPRNPVINTRSFGEDPARVGVMAAGFARGVAAGGMIATLKHFPGHGDTDVDSHLGLPIIQHPFDRLNQVELTPFRRALGEAGAVMMGHIEVPALDPERVPATLSRRVVDGLLRRQLGFSGLVYTDSLSMQAVARLMPPGEAAVRAVQAGNDFVIESPDIAAAFAGIKSAVERGTIEQAQLDRSVRRILDAKARLRLQKTRLVDLDALPTLVGGRTHAAVADEVSRRSITLLKDERQDVPLLVDRDRTLLYLSVLDYPGGWGVAAPSRTLLPELRKRWPNVTAVELSDRSTTEELELVRAMAPRFDAIVAGVFVRASSASGRMDLAQPVARLLRELAREAADRDVPLVAVLFGNPYVASALPELPAMLLTYDFYDRAEASAAGAIAGDAAIGGRLPIALPGLFPLGHGLDRAPLTTR